MNSNIILVTGRSGSGKTSVSKMIASSLNYKYIDVDSITHSIYDDKSIYNKAIELFGIDIVDANGTIDRKKLGAKFFNEEDKSKVQYFNDIAWKAIEKSIDSLIQKHNNVVIDWILSPITKYWDMSKYKLLVRCSDDKRLLRVVNRDNISIDYARARDRASVDFTKYKFDYIIDNEDDVDLEIIVKEVLKIIVK